MPKEKAKELVDKIFNQLKSWGNPSYENAKQGALIVVDEILEELPEGSIDYGVSARRRYFEEVKEELEKL